MGLWSLGICSELFLAESSLQPHLLIWALELPLSLLASFELLHESEINCVLSRVELTACAEICGQGRLSPSQILLILLVTGAGPLWMVRWLCGFSLLSLSPLSFGVALFVSLLVPFRRDHSCPLLIHLGHWMTLLPSGSYCKRTHTTTNNTSKLAWRYFVTHINILLFEGVLNVFKWVKKKKKKSLP